LDNMKELHNVFINVLIRKLNIFRIHYISVIF